MCYNFICYERFVDKNLWCCDLVWNSWQCIQFPLFGVFSDQVKLGRDIGSVRLRVCLGHGLKVPSLADCHGFVFHSTLFGCPLPVLMDSWTRDTVSKLNDIATLVSDTKLV